MSALHLLRGKQADIGTEWKAMEKDLSQNSVAKLSSIFNKFRKKEVIIQHFQGIKKERSDCSSFDCYICDVLQSEQWAER